MSDKLKIRDTNEAATHALSIVLLLFKDKFQKFLKTFLKIVNINMKSKIEKGKP